MIRTEREQPLIKLTSVPRFVRWSMALLMASLLISPLSQVLAQDDELPGVDGASYTSPTFGYSFSWDDGIWGASDASSEGAYDWVLIESDGASLYVDGVYFYQGDPDECLAGERFGIADESGLDDLAPLEDDSGATFEESGDGWAYGLYGLPVSPDDEELDSAVYLECRTLIPDSAVLIITAFMDPNDIDAQLAEVIAVADTIEVSESEIPSIDDSDLEQIVRTTANDVDDFWTATFADLGQTYVVPNYITFGEQIETGCGDANAGEDGPFYCGVDQTVYLDLIEITNGLLPYGTVVLQMAVAHELGHHVQELLGLTGCRDEICGVDGASLAIELQADCLAGAWMRDAAARGYITPQDLKRVEIGIKDYLADPEGTAADDPEAHGSGDMRFQMFSAGFTEGIDACSVT